MNIIGSSGFIAWFSSIFYLKLREASKNMYVKITVHALGVAMIIIGWYLLITTLPSVTSCFGMFVSLAGVVVFFTPLGLEVKS